jgi:hypothetical protein
MAAWQVGRHPAFRSTSVQKDRWQDVEARTEQILTEHVVHYRPSIGEDTMPCYYRIEELLAVLRVSTPEKASALASQRRRVKRGLLSVGLKIHYLGKGTRFAPLVSALGGASQVLEMNHYKNANASLCLVLPPVGSADSAITLVESLETCLGFRLFANPEIQIQVCSPGRLSAHRAAFLAIAFYLGSDTLRRYSLAELETTFSSHSYCPRGRRLVLYDAGGEFDREFEWWKQCGDELVVEPQLPIENGRSDLLVGSGSRLDIRNINLLATLLMHVEHGGYWKNLGRQFEREMADLLDRHMLTGLVDAPWIRTEEPTSADDNRFFAALQELVAYAFEEAVRIKEGNFLRRKWREIPARASCGILQEVQLLLGNFRAAVMNEVRLLDQGGRL